MDLSNSELCGDSSLHDKDSSGDSRTSLDSGISMNAVNFMEKSLGKENDLFSEEYLRRMSVLQKLAKEEEQLKIVITYEKLRKQQPILLDADLLKKKIAEHKTLLQEARSGQKMKNVMCTNLQLAKTLQSIIGFPCKTKEANKKNQYSEAQRRSVRGLLKKKKELSKRIFAKRQEIAKVDEHILKLKKHILNEQKRNYQSNDQSSISDIISSSNYEKLKRLTQSNEKLCDRVHLLSNIIQSLIPHAPKHQENNKSLCELMLECEKISSCQFNNVNDIEKLLENICSVNP